MPQRLPPEKEKAIWKLLQRGVLSHRRIATIVGCSRGVVCQISVGRRSPTASTDWHNRCTEANPLGYCEPCGLIRRLPCVVCRAKRQDSQAKRARRNHTDNGATCRIELSGDARERWLALQKAKATRGEEE